MQPFRASTEYSAVLDNINRQLCRATMFEARKRLAAEQACALLRKEQFGAAMKLIKRQHTNESKDIDENGNLIVNVDSGESAEVEKPAKAVSE